jgi:hypothetical protein
MAEDSPEIKKMKEHEKNIIEPIMKKPDKDPGGAKQWEKEHPKGPK